MGAGNMSYFKRTQDMIIDKALSFGVVTDASIQQFKCKSGEIAGFQVQALGLGPDGNTLYISQIYNYSSGTQVLLGSASVLPGIDLTGGYFSSGVFPSTVYPFTDSTTFYKVDYV